MSGASQQLELLSLIVSPPISRRIEPFGEVVRGEVDTVHRFQPDPRKHWFHAVIELHPHEGLWMWSTIYSIGGCGESYRVGPKWGRFAATKSDALHWAVEELAERLASRDTDTAHSKQAAQIMAWAQKLKGKMS